MYDKIMEQIEAVVAIHNEPYLKAWKIEDLKEMLIQPEIRNRIDVKNDIFMFQSTKAYYLVSKEKVLYAGDLIEGKATLSLLVDFNDKEELMLLAIYIGLGRRDLAEKLLRQPNVLMMYASQI